MNQPENKTVIDEAERQALLDEICQRFGVQLLWYNRLPSPGYRQDVTAHGYFDPEGSLTDDIKQKIRRWVESQRWQFSRQLIRVPGDDSRQVEYIFFAPIIPIALNVGYHATRSVSLPSIRKHGLLPSVPDRQTTERGDCEGNIYLCERLGTLADAGVRGSESAHWWRAHLAEKNRFDDPEWVILRVEVGELESARIYKDIWSNSGIIVDDVARIAPDLLHLVYLT